MFGLFAKKPSKSDSVAFCQELIRQASIDIVLEKGKYKAFIVQVGIDAESLSAHFKHPEAQSAIISAVEDRITNHEYKDPSDGVEMVREMRQMTGWTPNINVLRAVLTREGKPLFSWNPQPNS